MPPPGDNQILVLKRKKVVAESGHHGGAWKVAYADFVTAMMAFFLLMWLLNATTEEQRKGLADYFNPSIPISRTSAGGAGMLAGRSLLVESQTLGDTDAGIPPRTVAKPAGAVEGGGLHSIEAPPGETADPADLPLDSDAAASEAAREAEEQARLERVGREIAAAAEAASEGSIAHHFYLRITPEGLVIEIIEADGEPLFASASAQPSPLLRLLIDVLVPLLQTTSNDIAVVGHTDAVPFGSPGYSNWELSADRANAARRLLTAAGLPESRIARVTGKAAVEPLLADRLAPQNRRISVTLLRNQAG